MKKLWLLIEKMDSDAAVILFAGWLIPTVVLGLMMGALAVLT